MGAVEITPEAGATPPLTPTDEPKTMRELLFAGLLLDLEAAIEDERPESDEREHLRNPDGTSRNGSPYWQAWHRAGGMQAVLYLVRNRLATHEEYLVADRQRINGSWSEREMECARHRDVCPGCTETGQTAWKAAREANQAKHTADLYLSGIAQVRLAIARATETGHELTAAQIDKALSRVLKAAKRTQGGDR
jgi:hypothetical protein